MRKPDEESEKQAELPVTPEDLNGVRLSRWELADMKHRSFFKEMVVGEWSGDRNTDGKRLLLMTDLRPYRRLR